MSSSIASRATRWIARRSFEWCVDYYDGRRIKGWVGCRTARRSSCMLAFWRGGEVVATTIADIRRRDIDLLDYGPAGFCCAFGQYVSGPIALAAISPVARSTWQILEPHLEPGIGCGSIESISAGRIRGWAAAPGRDSNTPLEVALWRGDVKVATTQVKLKRLDIAEGYGLENPNVGFDLPLPIEATAFSKERFALKSHYGDHSSVIRANICFMEDDPGFETHLSFDPRSGSWI
ncbi:MAG TPA: hypothetical protein VK446_00085 [Methylocystis sp.]|nr:hypothetical protein [Methylocystis sp.]